MLPDTLKQLEFDKLLELVRGYCGCPLGEAKVLGLVPETEEDIPVARLRLASEASDYLKVIRGADSAAAGIQPVRFAGFTDASEPLAKLGVEGVTLEISEVLELLTLADLATDVRRTLVAARTRFQHLAREADRIADFHDLLRELRGKILPSGELDDGASPELKRIRREIEKQRGVILASLRHFLQSQSGDNEAQEEIITIRGDRFVAPVRAQRKGQVRGVVHGSSSSGQTVYVEPLETIELNNDLVRLREEEGREIHRILLEMTARLRRQRDGLRETSDEIAKLDLAFACGKYALDYNCVMPRFTSSPAARLVLEDARHPLLEALLRRKGAQAVPFSLALEDDAHVLVISGPNTGGKTVALKTCGLLALAAQAGLPVPATAAEFPFFDRVLADIGDYQSIQESLSTFSAHLVNIASMMERATEKSLILLDELGSATDPEEAGALGVAIVDRFRSAGAFTITSTHHLALKAYAMNTGGVRSANMGFDEQTLAPTYRLEVGWPGKSSGLAIAERLGMPHDVLERARAALSAAHQEVEQFLERLREEDATAQRLRVEIEEQRAALGAREREWNESQRKRESERATEWERRLEALWKTFESQAEARLRDLAARSGKAAARVRDPRIEAARIASNLRKDAREEVRTTLLGHWSGEPEAGSFDGAPDAVSAAGKAVVDPRAGDRVHVRSFGAQGIVRGRSGNWVEVEVGRVRTKVPLQDVAEVVTPQNAAQETAKAPPPSKVRVHIERAPEFAEEPGSSIEINVIGETADEARRRVDKFLDNAFLSQMARVRVVHGSGKGILRKALAELFTEHPHVEKFFQAPQKEGGGGATIVELKQ